MYDLLLIFFKNLSRYDDHRQPTRSSEKEDGRHRRPSASPEGSGDRAEGSGDPAEGTGDRAERILENVEGEAGERERKE